MPMRALNSGEMASLIKGLQEGTAPVSEVDARIHQGFSPAAKLSYCFVSRSLRSMPTGVSARVGFSAGFTRAWSEMFHNLAHWEDSNVELRLPGWERVLIVGWHFPELPLLLRFAREMGVLLLVSQDAPWLDSLKSAGCTLNFRAAGGPRELAVQMARGRLVGAMLDHIHPDTGAVSAPLFGRPARTPSGILDLCLANGYTIAFVAPRGDSIQIVHSLESHGHSTIELAAKVNEWLEEEVKRAPERWLMWPSVGFRFRREA